MLKQRYNKGKKSCQYLYSSAVTMINAIRFYNSPVRGDLERSFNLFYKSWDQLWQADRLINKNGDFFSSGDKVYSLNELLTEVTRGPNKKKENTQKPFCGYNFEIVKTDFRYLNDKNHPFFLHLDLLKGIRNIEQHDYIESSSNTAGVIIRYMNPYVIATLLNYIKIYDLIYYETLKNCDAEHRNSNQNHCSKKELLTTRDIKGSMLIPKSILEIENAINEYKTIQQAKSLDAKIVNADTLISSAESSSIDEDSLRVEISKIITAKNLKFENWMRNDPDKRNYEYFKCNLEVLEYIEITSTNKKDNKIISEQKNSAIILDSMERIIQNLFKEYKYKNLTVLATALTNRGFPFFVDRHILSNLKTDLLEGDEIVAEGYFWKKFWDDDTERYSTKFFNYIWDNYRDEEKFLWISKGNIKYINSNFN